MKPVKLSKPQEEALRALYASSGWESAYGLQASLATLRVLERQGLVQQKIQVGYLAFPYNAIKWRITVRGREVREALGS